MIQERKRKFNKMDLTQTLVNIDKKKKKKRGMIQNLIRHLNQSSAIEKCIISWVVNIRGDYKHIYWSPI